MKGTLLLRAVVRFFVVDSHTLAPVHFFETAGRIEDRFGLRVAFLRLMAERVVLPIDFCPDFIFLWHKASRDVEALRWPLRIVTITKVPTYTLREHVRSHTATLLRRMAFQVRQATIRADADAVHDLRVSIRRFRECLRTFGDLYPAGPRKKIRKELRGLMKCAEDVRSADIAIELLERAGVIEAQPLMREIREQRAHQRTQLHTELVAMGGRPYTRTWRKGLGL